MDFNWDELQRNYKPVKTVSQARIPIPKQKGFWTDQISTGGGIGGSLAGAATGAALGSVVPVVGTAAGGILGALLGGFGGGAAGQYVENGVTQEADMSKDVLKEGLINGVFGAGPIRAASLLTRTATGLARGAGKDALAQAGVKALTDTPIRSLLGAKIGGKITSTGENLLGSQANLTRAETRKLGTGATPAEVIGGINAATGLRSLDEIASVGSNVTGKNGVLSELTRNAVGNSKGVDIADLRDVANNLLIDKAPSVLPAQRKNVLEQVKNSLVKAHGGSKGSLNPLANPLESFDVARGFEAQAARLRTLPTPTAADRELADVYGGLAKAINDRLYSAPEVGQGVKLARDAAVGQFKTLAAGATSKTERNAYLKLAEQTAGLEDVASIRAAQAPFVRASKIDTASTAAQSGAGAQLGGQVQGLGRFVQKPTNMLAIPLDAATPRVGSAMARAGRAISGAGGGPGITPVGIASRVGLAGALNGVNSQSVQAYGMIDGQQENNGADQRPQTDPTQTDPTTLDQPGATNPFGVSLQDVASQMRKALENGDTKGYGVLSDMYDRIDKYESAGGSKMNATTSKALAQSANGINTINQLEQLLQQAGGSGGIVGGNIAGALGNVGLNNNAKTYNDLASGSVAQIAKALGETGALSDSDIRTYGAMLPKLTDTKEVAAAKLAALRQRLASAQQNTATYGGGEDLASILNSGGY